MAKSCTTSGHSCITSSNKRTVRAQIHQSTARAYGAVFWIALAIFWCHTPALCQTRRLYTSGNPFNLSSTDIRLYLCIVFSVIDLRPDRADCLNVSACYCADRSASGEEESVLGCHVDRSLVNSVFSSPCKLKHILGTRVPHPSVSFTQHNHQLVILSLEICDLYTVLSNIWMRQYQVSDVCVFMDIAFLL